MMPSRTHKGHLYNYGLSAIETQFFSHGLKELKRRSKENGSLYLKGHNLWILQVITMALEEFPLLRSPDGS
jgi:hypothetical protein